MCCAGQLDLKQSHDMHHLGVEVSIYLARKVDPTVSKDSMKKVVRECLRCQMIDPAPSRHMEGTLGVTQDWQRLAVDVAHCRQRAYLSMLIQ